MRCYVYILPERASERPALLGWNVRAADRDQPRELLIHRPHVADHRAHVAGNHDDDRFGDRVSGRRCRECQWGRTARRRAAGHTRCPRLLARFAQQLAQALSLVLLLVEGLARAVTLLDQPSLAVSRSLAVNGNKEAWCLLDTRLPNVKISPRRRGGKSGFPIPQRTRAGGPRTQAPAPGRVWEGCALPRSMFIPSVCGGAAWTAGMVSRVGIEPTTL